MHHNWLKKSQNQLLFRYICIQVLKRRNYTTNHPIQYRFHSCCWSSVWCRQPQPCFDTRPGFEPGLLEKRQRSNPLHYPDVLFAQANPVINDFCTCGDSGPLFKCGSWLTTANGPSWLTHTKNKNITVTRLLCYLLPTPMIHLVCRLKMTIISSKLY